MNSLIHKLLKKNIQYNILSLINVGMGFIFIILLGRKFGASEQTDIYFLSLVVITYLGFFVKSVWVAIKQYYIELKIKNSEDSKEIYNILLNNIFIVSMAIIIIYFVITANFDLLNEDTKTFMNVFIFYLLLQNILAYNKIILNLDHYYASLYLVDIFVYSVNLLVVLFFVKDDILLIAYSTIISTAIAILWQWRVIAKENTIQYKMIIYKKNILQEIYKNSFKINIGSILYGLKDIVTAAVFTSYGSGIYSLYSYASKFAGVILQVVNAPIVNVFTAKISHVMARKDYIKVWSLMKEVLTKTISLFLLASVLLYFSLPYVLNIAFGDKFTLAGINTIQIIFIYLIVYFSITTLEAPFVGVLNLLKKFNFGLFVNVVFASLMGLGYLIFRLFELGYEFFLLFLILAQLSNAVLYIRKYNLEIRKLV